MKSFKSLLIPILLTIAALAVYFYIQQDYRKQANHPQMEMAGEAAGKLSAGASPEDAVSGGVVEITSSLDPYLIVYDSNNRVAASNARINGQVPYLPIEVLDQARQQGKNTATWQPRQDLKQAVVARKFESGKLSGVVVAGRSLKEFESKQSRALKFVFLTWAALLLASKFILHWKSKK